MASQSPAAHSVTLEKLSFERYVATPMSLKRPARQLKLTDPRALRAVAHPLRLALVGLLRREGPLTATQAAERLGEVPAACSFHLRQLAKYGLVEEAGGGHGRERPWQATAMFTSWPSAAESPELAAASELLSTVIAERYLEHLFKWLETRAEEPHEWQERQMFSDFALYLSSAELEELDHAIQELFEPYLARTANASLRPPDARLVMLIALGFPLPDHRVQ
jgi:predicted ArsR family transcriptional regulator